MAGSPSYAARWSFDSVGATFGGSSVTLDFTSDTLQKVQPILIGSGMRGYRPRQKEQSRQGPYTVAGTLNCQPSPQHLSYLLMWAMGGGVAAAPAFANALALRDAIVDRTGTIYRYGSLAINRLTLTGRAGQLCDCSIDVVGKTEAVGATFAGAALGSDKSWEPLQHADLVITLVSAARSVEDFNLVLDNAATPKWRNSLSASELTPGNSRGLRCSATSIFTSTEHSALYGMSGAADTSGSLVLTNGTVSATFTFAQLKYTERSALPQGDEFLMAVEADVMGTAGGNEFTCAIDLTP